MTKQEIKSYIAEELANEEPEIYLDADDYKVILEALSVEPCEDCVSRSHVLSEFKRIYFDNDTVIRCAELVLGAERPVYTTPKKNKEKCTLAEKIADFTEDNYPTEIGTDWERGCAYALNEIEKICKSESEG